MEEKKSVKKTAKSLDTEAIFAVFLIFFIVCMIIFTAIMTIGAFKTDAPKNSEETEEEGNENLPLEKQPAFSGAPLASLPTRTDSTQQIDGVSSEYAVLVDVQTRQIVASKQESTRFAPASMTKVMTLIVALEHLTVEELDKQLEYTQEIFDYTSSGAYVGTDPLLGGGKNEYTKYLGDRFKIRDLLYGIGMASSAECTYMICKEISGSESEFVALMNQKAAEMGLSNTHFDNAIGHESENNYTTANDLAAIMMYALQSDLIKEILSKKDAYRYEAYYDEDGEETSYNRQFNSTLKDRLNSYKNTFGSTFHMTSATLQGGKTGYLKENGVVNNCLVSWATSDTDGTPYVLVLGCNPKNAAYTMKDVKTVFEAYVE